MSTIPVWQRLAVARELRRWIAAPAVVRIGLVGRRRNPAAWIM